MIERIKCAATRHFGGGGSDPVIIGGRDHAYCMAVAKDFGLAPPDPKFGQGFLTDRMRYVLRREALVIAKREGQIVKKHKPDDVLLSEDLK